FDRLRFDPAFKPACGRLADTGRDLFSQPTISRWENAPTLREIIRLTYALVDIWCRSYQKPPRSVVLDIDDTVDVVHGHQQSKLQREIAAMKRDVEQTWAAERIESALLRERINDVAYDVVRITQALESPASSTGPISAYAP